MSAPTARTALYVGLVVLVVAALGVLGRTVDHHGRESASRSGRNAGYAEGLRVGEAQGRQEGRALQAGESLPANSRKPAEDAFNAGYAAGANDVFAGYDGGWAQSAPYVMILEQGSGGVTYRIRNRTLMQPNVNYYLCPNGRELCQQPRP